MITVKTDKEIALMRGPCHMVRDLLESLSEKIEPGMTTKQVDAYVYDFITVRGARPSFLGLYGYPASACVSINEEVVHGIPSADRVIRDGDIVSVDVGAYLDGFHSDAARTYCVGDVSAEKRQLVRVTEECFFKGIEGLMPGSPLYDIGAHVQAHAESFGYGVVRALCGHGVGRKMHEDPNVPNYGRAGTGIRLKAGTTLAIEPMINMGTYEVRTLSDGWTVVTADGKPAAHYENTVAITADGVEILTL